MGDGGVKETKELLSLQMTDVYFGVIYSTVL